MLMLKKISSLQHPLVKHLIKIRLNKVYRYQQQTVIVEGIKPVRELSQSQAFIQVIATDQQLIDHSFTCQQMTLVTEEVMQKISGMQQPEGLMVEIAMPLRTSLTGKRYILALDGINDPGNLGNLIRTALGLGWEGIFMTANSCDPFNEKALRAARGATFHMPLFFGSPLEILQLAHQNALLPLVATMQGQSLEIIRNNLESHAGILLIMGNEARGVSSALAQQCQQVAIPLSSLTESLNVAVAGGILMFNLLKKNDDRRK